MTIQRIIQESINKNPLDLKEALTEELRGRIRLALEAKMSDDEDDGDDEDDDDQLDEISKKTVVSYLTKSLKSQDDAQGDRSFKDAAPGFKPKDPRTYSKRGRGISQGVSKIVGTARIKATESFDLSDYTVEEDEEYEEDDDSSEDEDIKKESVEQLDELSPKTLQSYTKKANKHIDKLDKIVDRSDKIIYKHRDARSRQRGADYRANNARSDATLRQAETQANRAARTVSTTAKKAADAEKIKYAAQDKIDKRQTGINRAYDRLHKEE
jgi:hypothetical protein